MEIFIIYILLMEIEFWVQSGTILNLSQDDVCLYFIVINESLLLSFFLLLILFVLLYFILPILLHSDVISSIACCLFEKKTWISCNKGNWVEPIVHTNTHMYISEVWMKWMFGKRTNWLTGWQKTDMWNIYAHARTLMVMAIVWGSGLFFEPPHVLEI